MTVVSKKRKCYNSKKLEVFQDDKDDFKRTKEVCACMPQRISAGKEELLTSGVSVGWGKSI